MSKANCKQPIDPQHPALSPTRPLFIDNRDRNTLDRAIAEHLRTLRREMALPWEVCVASAFFTVPGFNLLADELEQVGHVRLLLGAEPRSEATLPPRQPGDPPEPEFTRRQVGAALKQLDDGLRRARDLLPFDEATDAALRRMLELLHHKGPDGRPKIEVRRYEDQFLHAKAFIFRVVGGGTVVGSSNLTYGGLRSNLELNLGHYEDPVVGKVEGWFDELWAKAAPYDLAAVFDRLMAEYPPYLIYLRVLYALYGDELQQEEEELRAVGEIPLTTFQKHGVWRALRILRKYGGVLVADGVGLGKTFIAGEVVRLFRERRQRVLLVCPATQRDSTWKRFLADYELFVDCVSFEQLAGDFRLGGDRETLKYPPDDYALAVIDEAHNYRNPDAPARAGVLRHLLMGRRRDLVLMSATPVNNSLWDLYHVLHYFVKQDAVLADRGVLSIRERFDDAMREDPFNLNPDLLYPIIDATTVKRTRQFIKKHYQDDLITLPDGTRTQIRFPKPVASSINHDLEEVLPGFLAELEDALMPPDGHPRLTMARYKPENYLAGEEPNREDTALVGLIRSALLKRFESSVYAFAKTTEKMVREHNIFLQGLDQGVIARKELLRELSASEDEEIIDELMASRDRAEAADDYDVEALRRDVRADRDLLEAMHRRARRVKPTDSPKLTALVAELASVAEEARKETLDEEDERRKHKVLVFSFYEDTVDWIESFLDRAVEKDKRLACYRGRIASVAGSESRGGITRQDAIYGFAPESSGAPSGRDQDRYDILLCTDVLAEGMNLQQCRNVINFDLPWNPMRLVQRHGRIDRIGSKHGRVFLRTFFPDRQLNTLLNLEERVRRKLAQAAASVGVEVAPIERGAVGLQTFAETREEIERLHRGDASIYEAGGTASAAQTGEEYRLELRKAMQQRGKEIEELPWKAGSGLAKGERRGHFFCAGVGERVYLRFVPFADSGGDDIVSELGTCLRMIECLEGTPTVLPLDLKQTAFAAWQRARQHIFDSWMHETDPANLQPRVPKLNREVAEFLRQYPPRDVEQAQIERCLEAVEAPCSRREENLLRNVFSAEYPSHDAKSKAILKEVERIGLEPFAAPSPLPPIEPDDVHLVCWLAIERAQEAFSVSAGNA
jgi:hypothetical protein